MLNVFQIKNAMDSLENKREKMNDAYLLVNKRDQSIFRLRQIEGIEDTTQLKGLKSINIDDIDEEEKKQIYKQLVAKLRSKIQNLENQIKFLRP